MAASHLGDNLTAFRDIGAEPRVDLAPTATGRLVLVESDGSLRLRTKDGRAVRLESARNPRGEAEALVNAAVADHTAQTVAILGVGSGALLEAVLARGRRALVVEFDDELASTWLSRRSWTEAIAANRLRVIVGPGYVGVAEAARFVEGVDRLPVIAQPVLVREYADEMATARQALDRVVRDALANADARRHFEDLALVNTLRNLPALAGGADVGALFGRFSGVPAIVVGAGPSLDENLEAIRDVQDRALVICADTALLPCLKAGVVPPLVVALDPSEFNGHHLIACAGATGTYLATEPSVDPAGVAAFAGRTFMFRVGDHAPWPWLIGAGAGRARLSVWGSVVTAALDLALQAGCPAIAFAGLDLAYTTDRPYCRGTVFEERWARAVADGHPLEEQWERSRTHRQLVDEPDVAGRTTQSAPHLLAFRDWIREVAASRPAVQFANATGAGVLHGPRIAQQSLSGFLRDYPPRRASITAGVSAAYAASIDVVLGQRLAARLADASPTDIAQGHSDRARAAGAHLSAERLPDVAVELKTAIPFSSSAPMAAAFTDRRVHLPEQTSLLAALAAGTLPIATSPDRERAATRLREAFDRLAGLVDRAQGVRSSLQPHDVFARWYRVPARLLFDWPQPLADEIDAFGSMLADAIRLAGPLVDRPTVDRLIVDDVVQCERAVDRRLEAGQQPDAALAGAVLVWQWTQAYALTIADDLWLTRSALKLLATPPDLVPANRPEDRMTIWLGDRGSAGARVPFLSGLSTMRAVSGLIAADSAEARTDASGIAGLLVSMSPLDARRLTIVDAIEPDSRPARGHPRAHLVYPLPDGHVLAGRSDGSGVEILSPSGELVGVETWPMPVRASMALGMSGRLAWHFPAAPRLLYREAATSRVEVVGLPVDVYDALARPDGSVLLATTAGLWTWTPGHAPEPLAHGPWLASLHTHGDAVRACPRPARDADGNWDATTEILEWQPGDTSFRAVPVTAGSAPFSVAEHAGWRAEAWLDGGVVRLVRADGRVFWLACCGPRSLAWAGPSLYVAIASGEVLRFPDLASRLAAA